MCSSFGVKTGIGGLKRLPRSCAYGCYSVVQYIPKIFESVGIGLKFAAKAYKKQAIEKVLVFETPLSVDHLPATTMTSPSAKPIVLITGANAGLELSIVEALCESSSAYEILVGCCSAKNGEDAIEKITKNAPNTLRTSSVLQVDLASDESIQNAAEQVSSRFDRLDVLVNNAGANFDFQVQSQNMGTRELWNATWDINVAGTQVLTEFLIPLLLKSNDPRLIFMTSGTASLPETDRTEGPIYERLNASPGPGWPKPDGGGRAYRSVKTGLNMMMRE